MDSTSFGTEVNRSDCKDRFEGEDIWCNDRLKYCCVLGEWSWRVTDVIAAEENR